MDVSYETCNGSPFYPGHQAEAQEYTLKESLFRHA